MGQPSVTRRSIVATAWTTPVVVAAASVPAYAATGAANVTTTLLPPVRVLSTLPINATLRNVGGQATASLKVVLELTVPAGTGTAVSSSTPLGWGTPSVDADQFGTSCKITYTASDQIAANGTKSFAPTLNLAGNSAAPGSARLVPSVAAPGVASPSETVSYS